MKKQWLGNLISVVLLVVGLVAWIMSPWFVVAGVAVLLALWLFLTRSGRLSLEAAKIGIASLPQRWGASSVIVVGIAGVVGVLVAMLAMGEGFKATLNRTGSDDTAIILRGGSQAETNSVITRDQVPLVSALDGIARGSDGKPLVSPELSQVVNLPSRSDGTASAFCAGETQHLAIPLVLERARRRRAAEHRHRCVGSGRAGGCETRPGGTGRRRVHPGARKRDARDCSGNREDAHEPCRPDAGGDDGAGERKRRQCDGRRRAHCDDDDDCRGQDLHRATRLLPQRGRGHRRMADADDRAGRSPGQAAAFGGESGSRYRQGRLLPAPGRRLQRQKGR